MLINKTYKTNKIEMIDGEAHLTEAETKIKIVVTNPSPELIKHVEKDEDETEFSSLKQGTAFVCQDGNIWMKTNGDFAMLILVNDQALAPKVYGQSFKFHEEDYVKPISVTFNFQP